MLKPRKARKPEQLCRVVPAIVARHPELLNAPRPIHVPKDKIAYYKKIQKRITSLVEDKILGII